MPEFMRQALISLLFKKEDPELLKNWRPSSLLNTDYKIITKVLVNRVKTVMPTIIRPDQCCSVPERSSEDMRLSYVTCVTIWKLMNEWPVPLYRLIKKKRLIMLTGTF